MEFKEAYEFAKDGKFIRPNSNCDWVTVHGSGGFVDDRNCIALFDPEQYTLGTWEIKPEAIYVWGSCDRTGSSYLHSEEPKLDVNNENWTSYTSFYCENIKFPKDKPQKFELVPVDD